MKTLWLILIIPSLLLGCHERTTYDRTPAGWHVHWVDQGTVASGLHTKLQLYELFDSAMERGILEVQAGWGFDPAYVRSVLHDRDALYTLIDNFYFPVIGGPAQDDPTAQYASGETMNRYEVYVAFYNKAGPDVPDKVPAEASPWTLKPSIAYPGLVYWGVEIEGHQYPATGYELHWQFTLVP